MVKFLGKWNPSAGLPSIMFGKVLIKNFSEKVNSDDKMGVEVFYFDGVHSGVFF